MPISQKVLAKGKVLKFLMENKIKYEIVPHRTVYTAHDKAVTLRTKPSMIGKTLILKTDNEMVFVLIAGNKNLDKVKFQKVLNAWRKKKGLKLVKKIDFISEKIMKNKFKGIKIGAIPPFGVLWKMPTFIDRGILKNSKIILNSGDYNFSIKVSPNVFKKIIPDLVTGNFSKTKK